MNEEKLQTLLREIEKKKQINCKWVLTPDRVWITDCGNKFFGDKTERFKWCPFCGRDKI